MVKTHMQNILEVARCATCRNSNRACDCCDPFSETGNTNYEEQGEFRAIFGVTMSVRETALETEKTDAEFYGSIAAIRQREIQNMQNMGNALQRPDLAKKAIEEYKEQQGMKLK